MSESVSLLVGGKAHQEWESYRIDSDLLQPADDWQMTASFNGDDPAGMRVPDFVFEGAPAKVMIGGDVILDGLVDTVEDDVTKRGHYFEMYGRDKASLLLDCSAPILSMQKASLEEIVRKAVLPLGIKTVKYLGKANGARNKVHTEPGQSVWEWLQSACEANQVWPWFAPDGALVIGAPDYTVAPAGNLVMRFNGEGNNILSVRRVRSLHHSYSQVTVLGQSAGEDGEVGQHDIKGTATDATVPIYRPRVIIDGNCETVALATRRANKVMADGRMARDRLTVKVEGHRVGTMDGSGALWTPGMRVHVVSEPSGVDGIFFLTRRTFILSRADGQVTELHLIRDGTWLLNVPFAKDERRANYGRKKGHYAEGNN